MGPFFVALFRGGWGVILAREDVQVGVASDGNGIVLLVPPLADRRKPKVSELTAVGVIKITYGLAGDGFDHQTTVNKIDADRYTLAQALSLDGTKDDAVTFKYVYNRTTPTAVETALGTPGIDYDVVKILGYPNDHVITATTKINAIIPITTSLATDVPPAKNTELMKQMTPNIRGEVAREHEITVVAGP